MFKIIYRKSDLVCVGVVQENTDYEWELKHNILPNFGGSEADYDLIETNKKRIKLDRNETNIIPIEILDEDIPSTETNYQKMIETMTDVASRLQKMEDDMNALKKELSKNKEV